jgi:hypothetical protein
VLHFEKLLAGLFCKLNQKYQPDCSIIFLNSLAHLQHHYWCNKQTISKPLAYGYRKMDEIIGKIITAHPNANIVVHNGLSQKNTNDEPAWVLYRQKNPERFFRKIGIAFSTIEQNMTHDGHLFFDRIEDKQHAFNLLSNALVEGKPLFHIEDHPNENRLFYRLDFTDRADASFYFSIGDQKFRFFDFFDEVVTRTGKHIPAGTIYSNKIDFSGIKYNHEFNHFIYKHFGISPDSQSNV